MYYNRNLITAEQHPATLSNASGVFNLQSQAFYRSQFEWPFGDDVGFAVVVEIELANTELELRKVSVSTNYTVDWGDGSSLETSTADNLPHTYTLPGTYIIKGAVNSGTWIPWANNKASQKNFTKFELRNQPSIASTGTNYRVFRGMSRLTAAAFPPSFFASFTNLNSMFTSCSSLQSVILFDTSNCTNLGGLFGGCYVLKEAPLFDCSSNTNLGQTFKDCFSLRSIPPFADTSKVTSFNSFTRSCYLITSFPSLDFSSATNCGYMCFGANSLKNFPANRFDTTGTLIANAFHNAFNGCNLSVQSIENILVSLVANGATGITLAIGGGNNPAYSTWSSAAQTALTTLQSRSWNVTYNT